MNPRPSGSVPRHVRICPECNRRFDLMDATDADEWSYGHDCEEPPLPAVDPHLTRLAFLRGEPIGSPNRPAMIGGVPFVLRDEPDPFVTDADDPGIGTAVIL